MTSVTLVDSVCVQNVNFTAFITDSLNSAGTFREEISQNEALDFCSNFDSDFTLGPLENLEQYEAMRNLISLKDEIFNFERNDVDHEIGFFIGMEAVNGNPSGGGDTSVFSFLFEPTDPNTIEFYDTGFEQFPWNGNEPNNRDGNQNCVQMLFFREIIFGTLFFGDGGVDDTECDSSSGFICRGSCFLAVDPDGIDPVNDDNELESDDNASKIVGVLVLLASGILSMITAILMASYIFSRKKLRDLLKEDSSLIR